MSNIEYGRNRKSLKQEDSETGATIFEFRWDNKEEKFHSDIMTGRELSCPNSLKKVVTSKDVEALLNDIKDIMKMRKTGPYYEGSIRHYVITLIVYTITWALIFGAIVFFAINESSRKKYYWLMGLPVLFSLLAVISMADEHKQNKIKSAEHPIHILKAFENRHGTAQIKVTMAKDLTNVKIFYQEPDFPINSQNNEHIPNPQIIPYAPKVDLEDAAKVSQEMNYPSKDSNIL